MAADAMTPGVLLPLLVERLPLQSGCVVPNIPLAGMALDSRQCGPDFLFVALRGHRVDGREYIGEAVARGATAVLIDAEQ